MIKNCTKISLVMLLLTSSCKNIESKNSGPNKTTPETEKMEIAYVFLLKKLEQDNLNLIASENDENFNLIKDIIKANKLDLEAENYANIESGPDLCYYSKSTRKVVAIVRVTRRDENKYYVSYYIGPEGGASKEIQIEKRKGKWIVVNDDGMWIVK